MTPEWRIRSTVALCAALILSAGPGCSWGNDSGGASELRAEAPAEPGSGDDGHGDERTRRPAPATAWVIFGADTVVAEVASTADERADGLMYRERLAEDAGMLFVFPESSVRTFWMQNTYIPLDIAFMDPSFRIVDIQQMDPMTTESHMSRAPAMYALEVNQGWFRAHGVQVGDQAEVVFGS